MNKTTLIFGLVFVLSFVSVFAAHIQLDVTQNGTFSRNSTSYLLNSSSNLPVAYGTDTRRLKPFATHSAMAGGTLSAENIVGGGTTGNLSWIEKVGSYFYAADNTAKRYYRSTDGFNWTVTAPTNVQGVYKLFGLSSGRILRIDPNYGVWYSDDLLESWLPVNNTDNTSAQVNMSAGWRAWNVYQALNGTIIVSTYGGPPQIWRSVNNGATFKKVYEVNDSTFDHFHGLAKQEATGRWFQDAGDGRYAGTCTANATTDNLTCSSFSTVGVITGDAVLISSTGTYPAPLTENVTYYVRNLSATVATLHPTYADAIANTNIIDITDAGSGTHYIVNNDNYLFYSDDDGITWNIFSKINETNVGNPLGQTTAFKDYSDATKLYAGSDNVIGLGSIDVISGEVEGYTKNIFTNGSSNYIFDFTRYNNTWIAPVQKSAAVNPPQVTVGFSDDLENWVHYVDPTAYPNLGAISMGGFYGDILHYTSSNVAIHYHQWVKVPTIKNITGIVIEPATTNLLTGNDANMTSPSGWSTSLYDTATYKDGSINVVKSQVRIDRSNININRQVLGFTPGAKYVFSYWAKGHASSQCAYEANQAVTCYGGRIDTWSRFYDLPFSLAGNSTYVYAAASPNYKLAIDLNISIDNLMVQPVPSTEWIPGTSNSTTEILSFNQTLPAAWTNVFQIHLRDMYSAYGSNNLSIMSYKINSSDYSSVYYDPLTYKFCILSYDAGVAGEVSCSNSVTFPYDHTFKFATRYANNSLLLSFENGGQVQHLTTLNRTGAKLEGTGTIITGNESGGSVIPMVLGDMWLNDANYTNAEIEEGFNQTDFTSFQNASSPVVTVPVSTSCSLSELSLLYLVSIVFILGIIFFIWEMVSGGSISATGITMILISVVLFIAMRSMLLGGCGL